MFVVRCKKEGCGGLLRPHVVWFGEGLDPQVMSDVQKELDDCDLCLVVSKLSLVINILMIYWQDFQISSSHPWYSTHPSSRDRGLTVYMYIATLFAQVYVRVDISLTWGKHLHDRIISLREVVCPIKLALLKCLYLARKVCGHVQK